ncbi:MAG: hypothetical protein ACOYNN_14565 [Terrimicrobiaceae bacterium]|jgi:transcription initiation factor IIE alpha subunit
MSNLFSIEQKSIDDAIALLRQSGYIIVKDALWNEDDICSLTEKYEMTEDQAKEEIEKFLASGAYGEICYEHLEFVLTEMEGYKPREE